MAEIEHFLDDDYRFSRFIGGLERQMPGPDRDQWFKDFLRGIRSQDEMTQERLWQACRLIALYDDVIFLDGTAIKNPMGWNTYPIW
jgi:hypothetical protein